MNCKSCGARLARHNAYFRPSHVTEPLCGPCRWAEWTPDPLDELIAVGSGPEDKMALAEFRAADVATAFTAPTCECESPIPVVDDDGDRSCLACGHWIEVVLA